MNKQTILKAIGIFIIGVGTGLLVNQHYHESTAILPEKTPIINRCIEDKNLYVQHGFIDKHRVNIDELWSDAKDNKGTTILTNKKQKTGVKLSWLVNKIGKGNRVEIQPCQGNPLLFNVNEISSDSTKYILLKRPHNQLKLVDTSISNQKPLIRGIHLIRVLK